MTHTRVIARRGRELGVTALMIGTLVGCQAGGATGSATQNQVSVATSGAPAATSPSLTPVALKSATLRIEWSWLVYHMPFVYALQQGWYRDAGIDLTIKEGQGSGTTLTLVAAGKDTFGLADTNTMLVQASKGAALQNVLVIQRRSGFGTACFRDVNFQKPTDLEGHSVLVVPTGSSGALWSAYLKINGVDETKVRALSATSSDKVQLFVAHKADCMAGFVGEDTLNAQLLNPAIADAIAWVDEGVALMGLGIEINPQTAKDNPDMVKGFVAATIKGWQAVCANPQLAVDLLKTKVPNLTEVDLNYATISLPQECGKNQPAPADTGTPYSTTTDAMWQNSISLMSTYAGMVSPRAPSSYYTNQFIPVP